MGRHLLLVVMLGSLAGWAQPLPPPPPPTPPPVAEECFPACRNGFFCLQGQCRSACNPPCNPGEQCQEDGQCTLGDAPVALVPQGPMVNADGERAPPGFHWELQPRKGMMIAGIAIFGVGYVMSLLYGVLGYTFAGTNSPSTTSWIARNRTSYLAYLVPVAGPGICQALMATSVGYSDRNRELELMWMALMSVVQTTGATLGFLGGLVSREVAERDRIAGDAPRPVPVRWSVAPFAPGSAFGISLRIEN